MVKKRLNLNPKSIEENSKDKESAVLIVVYAAVVLVLCLNIFMIYLDNVTLKNESETLNSQIVTLKEESNDFSNIKKEIDKKTNFINKANAIDININYKDYIGNISKYVPKGITIESATYNAVLISLNGTAKTRDEVAVFLANLQMSKEYSNAEVISITVVQEEIAEPKVENKIEGVLDIKNTDENGVTKEEKVPFKGKVKPKTKEKIQFSINIKE